MSHYHPLIAELGLIPAGDRQHSDKVLLALGWEDHGFYWHHPDGRKRHIDQLQVTTSIDDAKRLASEAGLVVSSTTWLDGHGGALSLTEPGGSFSAGSEALAVCMVLVHRLAYGRTAA